MKRYNPKELEPKWQKTWEDQKIYQATEDTTKPKKYILEYFPYPSGAAMHVGHVRNYTIGDVVARHSRMNGYNVLHPMGWDSFGLPAENYAIKHNISPKQAIIENTGKFKQQLTQMGFSYDWSREIDSSDPDYYKWTQWFFTLLFKKGLAYRKESIVNWDPVDKTVLANEQVVNGIADRSGAKVEKIPLAQWFFKITDYADRLVEDLEDLDWSDSIKAMQRNWIGKSKGAEVDFAVVDSKEKIRVYTTRADTLFGATFVVLAPEHPLVNEITSADQKDVVQKYIEQTHAKTDIERQETDREKTGVFTGAYVTNPVNNEKIPVWIADYVLTGYGTGAIMAVPAHDERDHEFAKKFDLPITTVILPQYEDVITPPREGIETVKRQAVGCIVKHPTEDKYLLLDRAAWETKSYSYVTGGLEKDETPEEAAVRELKEETGYVNHGPITQIGEPFFTEFYHEYKRLNRYVKLYTTYTELKDLDQIEVDAEEAKINKPVWVSRAKVVEMVHGIGPKAKFNELLTGTTAYGGEGVMVNSGKYDGVASSEVREKIVADLAKQKQGQEKVNYKIRDWLISRQRYWGAPIPMIWVEKEALKDTSAEFIKDALKQDQTKEVDGKELIAVPVPEAQLPVVLPEVDSYQPDGTGKGPLARAEDWVHVWVNTKDGSTKPFKGNDKAAGWVEGWRETDTMDGFACSSWYFLRFADPHNKTAAFSADKVKFWLPVDDYIGGAEHAVMHLLYARMWTKVMFDEGLIEFNEPFKALRNHGMILAPDGRKMSKSWGNVIAPDEIIDQGYGADAIRLMELFIGPWNQSAAWSVEGMGGCFRFLQRVWTLAQEYLEAKPDADKESKELLIVTHKAVKKVSQDMHDFGFNTSIAALMELVNELYKIKADDKFAAGKSWKFALDTLLQLLAPYAPHMTEELWQQLGHKDSIHTSTWPAWDEKYLVADTITVVVQVNGKVRAQITVPADSSEEATVATAKADSKVAGYLEDKTIHKTIYVPGKLVSFVIS